MHRDGGGDGVVLGIDDGDGTLPGRRAGVDHIDFVAHGIGDNGGRILADGDFAIDAHVYDVVDRDGAAAAVGDVGVFAVGRIVLGKVVGAAGGEAECQRNRDAATDRQAPKIAAIGSS